MWNKHYAVNHLGIQSHFGRVERFGSFHTTSVELFLWRHYCNFVFLILITGNDQLCISCTESGRCKPHHISPHKKEDGAMKKIAYLILAVSLVISFSSFVYADDFGLIGREVSAGIDQGDRTVGAFFIGKFFDGSFSSEMGGFTLTLDHDGSGIEECGGRTQLLRFKLVMNFNSGARLVLLGPTDDEIKAEWDFNNSACEYGNCPLIDGADYSQYISLLYPVADPDPEAPSLYTCSPSDDGNAFIAKVPEFGVARQRFGSFRTNFTGGLVSGWLVHTPVISPAIFGTLNLSE